MANTCCTKKTMYDIIKINGPQVPNDILLQPKIEEYDISMICKDFQRRDLFTYHFSWAVPSESIINIMIKFINYETTLEIGAGLGLWSYLLKIKGGDIITTDIKSSDEHKITPFTDIIQVDGIEAIKKYDTNVLMFIWPSYGSSLAFECLKLFKGNKLIYIGEFYGATACDEFHELLKSDWNITIHKISQWYGMKDKLYICSRK